MTTHAFTATATLAYRANEEAARLASEWARTQPGAMLLPPSCVRYEGKWLSACVVVVP